jgi:predicted ATP-dependent serine protease
VADAPWRCSECGTINEPVANACRTCGRWPSLFDLEDSKLEELPPVEPVVPPRSVAEMEPVAESAQVDEIPTEEQQEPFEIEEADASPTPPWRRLLRFAVPIAVALYILISSALNR